MIKSVRPCRGEVWYVDLDPVAGHEQAKKRPCVIVSIDHFNHGPAGLYVIIPLTSTIKQNPFHILIKPVMQGLKKESFALCDQIRTVSEQRIIGRCLGVVQQEELEAIEYALRVLLCL